MNCFITLAAIAVYYPFTNQCDSTSLQVIMVLFCEQGKLRVCSVVQHTLESFHSIPMPASQKFVRLRRETVVFRIARD